MAPKATRPRPPAPRPQPPPVPQPVQNFDFVMKDHAGPAEFSEGAIKIEQKNPANYRTLDMLGGCVELPRSTPHGGVQGSDNIHGFIRPGVLRDGEGNVICDFAPPPEKRVKQAGPVAASDIRAKMSRGQQKRAAAIAELSQEPEPAVQELPSEPDNGQSQLVEDPLDGGLPPGSEMSGDMQPVQESDQVPAAPLPVLHEPTEVELRVAAKKAHLETLRQQGLLPPAPSIANILPLSAEPRQAAVQQPIPVYVPRLVEGRNPQEPAANVVMAPSPRVEQVRVTMSSDRFGEFSGQYLDVRVEETEVILIQSEDADSYTPPRSKDADDIITVSVRRGSGEAAKTETYKCAYFGIRISLPTYRVKLVIFHKVD